jgi:kynureninase
MNAARQRGWRLNTPERDEERGGSVVVDVPGAAAATDELLKRQIIVDYRPGAGIRLAPHFYSNEADIDQAVSALDEITAVSKQPARQ